VCCGGGGGGSGGWGSWEGGSGGIWAPIVVVPTLRF
jgi:hypothetical protein